MRSRDCGSGNPERRQSHLDAGRRDPRRRGAARRGGWTGGDHGPLHSERASAAGARVVGAVGELVEEQTPYKTEEKDAAASPLSCTLRLLSFGEGFGLSRTTLALTATATLAAAEAAAV